MRGISLSKFGLPESTATNFSKWGRMSKFLAGRGGDNPPIPPSKENSEKRTRKISFYCNK